LLLRTYGVSKTYPGGVTALRDVTVSIDKGEFVFLVGPSGSGKTTFTRLIYAEAMPDEGEIFFAGRNVTRLRRREIPLLRRRIGVVFQDFKLLPKKTAYDNVAFALEAMEAPGSQIRRQVPLVLALVGLESRARCYPHQLAGGEQQRVALARAIVNDPLLLLADEPTGNLDPDTSWQIMDLLADINRRGTTIIMGTHNKTIVDRLQQRVISIEAGRVRRDEPKGGYDHAAWNVGGHLP